MAKKVGARLIRPRQSHIKKAPGAEARFKQELLHRLEELQLEPEKRVRFWIQDETRLGLHTTVRHCWSLRGHQPVVPTQLRYQWMWVYGALEIGGANESVFFYAPEVSLACTHLHLMEIVATDPDAIHVVIYDGAGFHPDPSAQSLPKAVRILKLPPYCPELNPVEKLWDMLKDALCNQVFETLEDLDHAATEFIREFWSRPQRCQSLVGRGYLLQSVNACSPSYLPVFN